MGTDYKTEHVHVPETVRREAVYEFLEKINVDPREVHAVHIYADRVELVTSMFIRS